ncbi:tyrosine-protein kinase HTK16-like [Antedon mediterranea]|uniref:tyrosine-protein kinase HTK16-like n=1 Tax=Antedon mediterranea TaxID=105859 RepID=UPI003AF9AD12
MTTSAGGFNRTSRQRLQACHFSQDNPEVKQQPATDNITLSEVLRNLSLREYLAQEHGRTLEYGKNLQWYHGKISRETAVHILFENGNTDGLFLVRESTSVPGDYVLSLVKSGQPQHFQIHCCGDFFYQIESGPPFAGLENLISHYKESSDGLPTHLGAFCKGELPPPTTMKNGKDTPLHKVTSESNLNLMRELLREHSLVSKYIDARNSSGYTALQIAVDKGNYEMVMLLLDHEANVNTKDGGGVTALHHACMNNFPLICQLLVERGADPTARHHTTGWVPLHTAAQRGHSECVNQLLNMGVPRYPRNADEDTPYNIAVRYSNTNTSELLLRFVPPPPKTSYTEWFHGVKDRGYAIQQITMNGGGHGSFLVRTSTHKPDTYVLTMVAGGLYYNFEIETKVDGFHIDDGPFFSSLEYLVDHYQKYEDGLPCKLTVPCKPSTVVPLDNHRDAPPALGPRPPDMAVGAHQNAQQQKGPVNTSPTKVFSLFGKKKKNSKTSNEEKQDNLNIIDIKNIVQGRELGQGEFGSVLEGIMKDKHGKKHKVALKTLHAEHITTGQKEFLREAEVMCDLNHPCIVKLLGVVMGPPMMLVQELVPMGSLLDYLIDHANEVSEKDLKRWAWQISQGSLYLESKKFVHRDLAARNILLSTKDQAKISDFGLSRATKPESDYYRATTGGRWPVKWYAPESIYYGQFSHASDVWSFGVTLWEMYSMGDQPYGEKMGADVIKFIEDGNRLEKPEMCPQWVYEVMLKCWEYRKESRPTFETLCEMFLKSQ